jgi:hypothetical protein
MRQFSVINKKSVTSLSEYYKMFSVFSSMYSLCPFHSTIILLSTIFPFPSAHYIVCEFPNYNFVGFMEASFFFSFPPVFSR